MGLTLCPVWSIINMYSKWGVNSPVCCYVVYFVQRAWYLYRLRKPERIYTKDPLSAPERAGENVA